MPEDGENLNLGNGWTVPPPVAGSARRVYLRLALGFLGAAGVVLAGCPGRDREFGPNDLTPGERQYITRMVTLERAKAVALVDSIAGNALLDSLARAWQDSALARSAAAAARDPQRSQLVNQLLLDILAAEQDSLLLAPRAGRLNAPLPQPQPRPDPPGSSGP